jgi:Kef-type K+ transport system membrane component KefB
LRGTRVAGHAIVVSLLVVVQAAGAAHAGSHAPSGHAVALFLAEVALILLVARALSEGLQRIGQPAVMGPLLAGIAIGPSVLGALWPTAYDALYGGGTDQKRMVEGLSQFGILLLLLLSGMEIDLDVIRRMRRTAFVSSAAGIVVPFACGVAAGLSLPEALLPDPARRLATALFLATCVSVSSVKIVAMIVMESGFARRNVGQIILGTAIVDDTVGWILVGLISGFAAHGSLSLGGLGITLAATVAFLVASLTAGRRLIATAIRLVNDRFRTDFAVVTFIVVFTCGMALVTDGIGVHTALGAFIAGVLVGQSPIRRGHVEEQLRGIVVGFFAPVFFTLAGRSADLTILRHPDLLGLAAALIAIACLGKLLGGYLGGRAGQLSREESIALALGMNARGSTEVVVATIGLSIGLLTPELFTLVVITAMFTTMTAPPLMRWAFARIRPSGDEQRRLEREAAEAQDFVPHVERVLVAADDTDDGRLASMLAGLFVGDAGSSRPWSRCRSPAVRARATGYRRV